MASNLFCTKTSLIPSESIASLKENVHTSNNDMWRDERERERKVKRRSGMLPRALAEDESREIQQSRGDAED